jgi:hypothetical protein
LWFASKGNTPYPKHLTVPKKERNDGVSPGNTSN